MATPNTWHHSDPELWPSAAQASALLLSIETIVRLQEHIALTWGSEPMSLLDPPSSGRDSGLARPSTSRHPRRLFCW